MDYLRDHWRGRHPLPWAFWVNAVIPFIVIAMIEPWIRPAAESVTLLEAILAAIFVLIAHAVILPWQIVGLWRSSRRHLEERGDLVVVTFAQVAVLVALVTVAGATTTTVQRIIGYRADTGESDERTSPRYILTVLPDDQAIAIDGPIGIGLSRALENVLAKTPDIDRIILNSDGGRVFEARGVAKQIIERGLDTYVFDGCRSACTIAFIAGSTRMIGERGRLGFHSYRVDGVVAMVNSLDEQDKDRAFFLERGLKPDFVARVFATPHEEMWHPDMDDLVRANVVHQIVEP